MYCAKPFTVDDPSNYFHLKVKEKEKELQVCRACYGTLISLQDTMCGASAQIDLTQIKLFKVVSYSFLKEPVAKTYYTRGLPSSLKKATEDTRTLLSTSVKSQTKKSEFLKRKS